MSHSLLEAARAPRTTLLIGVLFALGACSDPPLLDRDGALPDAGPGAADTGPGFEDGGGIAINGLSLARVVPDHGPFVGGNTVVLRGTGFTDESFVSFGTQAVQPADHRLIDPRRLSVVVPAGEVGTVDVSITVGEDTVTLEDGYTYDRIYVDPSSGAVSGGTFVTITGSGTNFRTGDTVIFGNTPCTDVAVVSPTVITCRTPPMSAGTVDVTVTSSADGTELTAPDGFTYFDSSDPFTGGLGGGPISNAINLTVIDAMTGNPVPDAFTILGEDLTTPYQGLTDSLGQHTFSGPDIVTPVTIHVAKFCYEKTSFVAFDARDVTVFLVPWDDPMCGMGSGNPPLGRGRNGAFIEGELVWPVDMQDPSWFNVPEARDGWVRVAYVYTTQAALEYPNPDPAAGGGIQRVLESPVGERGYPYSIFARPAGLAVYALAGLENTATGRFIPYVMGIARDVLAGPGQTVTGVDILMIIPLDHYLDIEVTDLPSPVDTGPDRFRVQANIDLGGEGVIVREVNGAELDILRTRDETRAWRFPAQPALEEQLADGRYRVEVGWFTGDFDQPPFTVNVQRGITNVDATIQMGNFLGIPEAIAPTFGQQIPADRVLRWESDGEDPDLHVVFVMGADGNSAWRHYVPGNVYEAPIPDLSSIPGIDDMPDGFVTWGVYAIRIPGFDFNEFRYSDLNQLYWTSWAVDVFTAQR